MKALYALLVGIDDYPAPVPKLRGCINDVTEMRQFLEARVDSGGGRIDDVLKLKVLVNEEATRAAVIREFREHLGQAGPHDVAIFCYSGHGSQEPSPEQFWKTEPDRLDETLVLYDSRSEGSWDLADKELAKLISWIADKGTHVVVILDCCHSGSGTRALDFVCTAVRRAPTDLRQRPLETFLCAEELATGGVTRDLGARLSGWQCSGRHVLLAACRDDEEAKEYQSVIATRGAFSYFLGQTLRTVGGDISYRDLFNRAAALVCGQVQRQSPQLEASVADDLNRPFLGGAIRPAPRYFVATTAGGHWIVDAGQVHGIPAPAPGAAAELSLFAFTDSDEDLKDPVKSLAKGRVSKVFGATSHLEITEGILDPATGPLKAVLTFLPKPRMRVRLDGDAAGIELARRAIGPSRFVCEAIADEAATIHLIARRNQYLIAKPDDDRPLVGQIDGYTDDAARMAIERLEHIERWQTTAELDNAATGIGHDELLVEILQNGQPLTGSEYRMEYTPNGEGGWVNPEVTIRLRNNGRQALYVGLIDLPQTFGIFPMLNHVGSQRLEPGQETFANDGVPIPLTVPDEFWKQGMGEIKDLVKVIISTSEFDVRRLAQPDLGLPRPKTRSAALKLAGVDGGDDPPGTLERLLERVQTRHASGSAVRRIDDWRTLQFAFTTVRPMPAGRLVATKAVTLTQGVRIEAHPALGADSVRVSSLPAASRAVEGLARLLYDDPTVVQPFDFSTSRSAGGVLNVLEFSGVNNPALVTHESPLKVTIPRALGAGEHILPVAFDGEFYLPLGWAEAAGRDTHVVLNRLPRPSVDTFRGLGGALRIIFQKVIGGGLGTEYRYPILAAADVKDDSNVRYDPDLMSLRRRVAVASRIALLVHGIIGDTREMAASLRRTGIADRYDLVLTFDYENLQDPISDTASALKDRLAAVGLGVGHGKTLDVFAHSMGGLVSRWFIERDGGHQVIRRLILLGTPNGGLPWHSLKSWATTALAVGLNELGKVVWPATVFAGLIKAMSLLDITMEQMKPGSMFLNDLFRSPDPKIPYLLIAGETSTIFARSDKETANPAMLDRLLRRLWPDDAKYRAANLLVSGSSNDIAVSVASMRHIPDGRQHPLYVRTASCDHFSYFRHPDGLKAIVEVIARADRMTAR